MKVIVLLALTASMFVLPTKTIGQTAQQKGTVIRDVVLATIDSAGAIQSTQVAELVRLQGSADDPAQVTISPQDLGKVRSLSGFTGPANDNGSLIWRTTDKRDVVSLSKTTKGVPVAATLKYFLDGKPVTADKLKGASGHVRIEITAFNNAYSQKTLTYEGADHKQHTKEVKFYLPFEFSVLVNFSSTMWRNLSAPLSYIQTDAAGSQNVIHPGVLNPVVGPDHDTVVFEADGTHIQLPHIQIAFFPRGDPLVKAGIQEQVDGLGPLYDGLSLISYNMGKVEDGTLQLADGLKQIVAGVGQVNPSTGKAEIVLGSDGQPTTLVGGIGFIQDAIKSQLLPGIGSRSSRSGRANTSVNSKGVPQTLLYGLQSIQDALEQARAGVGQLTAGVNQLIGNLDGIPPGKLSGIKPGTITASNPKGTCLSNAPIDPFTGVCYQPGFLQGLQQIKQAADDGFAASGSTGLDTQFGIIQHVVGLLLDGIGSRNANGTPKITLSHGQPTTLIGGLGYIVQSGLVNPEFYKKQSELGGRTPHDYYLECPYCFDKTKSVYNPKTAPDKFQPHLSEAMALLAEGVGQIISQVNTLDPKNPGLVEGLSQMRDGLGTMLSGIQTFDPKKPGLVDGLQQVQDGVGQLSSGVAQLKQQGVDVATSGVKDGVDDVKLRAAIIAEQTKELQNYSFLAQGGSGATAFTTFVMDLAAQSTLSKDNLVRAVLILLAVVLAIAFGRRIRHSFDRFAAGTA